MINADAVFGGRRRRRVCGRRSARPRALEGLAPEELEDHYRERNLLQASVTRSTSAARCVFFASNATPTTGATLPVDGGIAAAFPR